MQPINFEGASFIGKPDEMSDEQCSGIHAMHGVDDAGYNYFLEAWKPSYEDLQAINRGEPIYIKILALGLPPISVFTLDENGEHNDAG